MPESGARSENSISSSQKLSLLHSRISSGAASRPISAKNSPRAAGEAAVRVSFSTVSVESMSAGGAVKNPARIARRTVNYSIPKEIDTFKVMEEFPGEIGGAS